MKRMLSLFLCLALVLALSLTVQADVIYEPTDDFYQNNYESCTYVNRSYTANGPDGTVTVYKSPVSGKVQWTMSNGEEVWISFLYTDDDNIQWGIVESSDDKSGWVPMAYLEVIYDNTSFWENYSESFLDVEGQLDDSYQGKTIWVWNYPGSESGYDFQLVSGEDTYLPEYGTVYQDPEGRSWAYILYYYGHRQVWFCLDDPCADFDTLYPDGAPEVEITDPTAPTEPKATAPIVPKESNSDKITLTVGILALVVVTVMALTKLKKKES